MALETLLTPEYVDRYTAAGYWTGETITDQLDASADRAPDKVAFVDSRRSVTFAELRDEVDRCAWGLRSLGVESGDVVSFQLPNWIEFVVLHLAAGRIGAVSNPLIPIYRKREVGFMVKLSGSKVIVVPSSFRGFDHLAMVRDLEQDWPALETTLVVDSDGVELGDAEQSFEEFMSVAHEQGHSREELLAMRPDPNEVTALMFTSGTTGEPKGVMHTHNTLVAANNPVQDRMGLTDETVVHMASTFAHLTGFLYGARLPIRYGLTCVLQDVWNAEEFVRLVQEHKISYTSGATPFLVDLLSHLPEDRSTLDSLTRFCCMGAPIPRAIARQAMQELPQLAVLGGWGQTENGLVCIGIPGDPIERITSTDGYPWPGMEIRVVDFAGEPVEAGVEGRLQVRGPFLFVGYAHRLELTKAQFEDGWFDTGDLATIDTDGYLSIAGRTKDIIVRGGENIPVAYVENVLYENPDFGQVALVGRPDARLQEKAVAYIVLKPGVTTAWDVASVQQYLADKGVAKQYWPEYVEVLEQLPSTPSGKIQKFQLRKLAAEAAESGT